MNRFSRILSDNSHFHLLLYKKIFKTLICCDQNFKTYCGSLSSTTRFFCYRLDLQNWTRNAQCSDLLALLKARLSSKITANARRWKMTASALPKNELNDRRGSSTSALCISIEVYYLLPYYQAGLTEHCILEVIPVQPAEADVSV